MFNPEKRVLLPVAVTVSELIEELSKIPGNYAVSICGAYNGYIHVDDTDQGITLDCEPLDEEYPEDAFENEEEDD